MGSSSTSSVELVNFFLFCHVIYTLFMSLTDVSFVYSITYVGFIELEDFVILVQLH